MCIGSNWVNEAQDLMYVTKFCDLPNKQDPNIHHSQTLSPRVSCHHTTAKTDLLRFIK